MPIIKFSIPYEVKEYDTSSFAGTLDRILQKPSTRILVNTALSMAFIMLGVLFYNLNDQTNNIVVVLLMIVGFVLLISGGMILGPLARKLKITERIACLAGKRQRKLPGRLLYLVANSKFPKIYRHSSDDWVEMTIGTIDDTDHPDKFLLVSEVHVFGEKENPVVHAQGTREEIRNTIFSKHDEIAKSIETAFISACTVAKEKYSDK